MIGDKLVELRKSKKKTQQDMADILGIVKGTYSSYEQNRRTPDNEMQIKIADYFDITLDELNGRTPKESSDDFDAFMFEDKEAFDALPEEVKQELIKEINEKIEFLSYKQKNKNK
ncbi:helix-turn-helix domain-containing protein [Jeotgalicoccus sp. S0W5]|uniref:helix-turn-helix domain-containing protein n=1 Tax=Jeotgalicoccus sp. S0W5 TaxID=2527874 RepID=UPI0014151051|nr:helix-turn-helix transcriptional regulator [Jeotgalicoccus sp. S0W5]